MIFLPITSLHVRRAGDSLLPCWMFASPMLGTLGPFFDVFFLKIGNELMVWWCVYIYIYTFTPVNVFTYWYVYMYMYINMYIYIFIWCICSVDTHIQNMVCNNISTNWLKISMIGQCAWSLRESVYLPVVVSQWGFAPEWYHLYGFIQGVYPPVFLAIAIEHGPFIIELPNLK